ncbi:hypothetical protein [Curtobacterium flaccumfaciens]|uniref:hypothetical protein n=1 Tax=Curtobacterium flaccumfaciens TaxID=2035 RepID=UPI001E4A2729|nr:hypothetical protein [Curtobacterium allii]MCE0459644.1 hypothetical protein [Curtobacterium allii]
MIKKKTRSSAKTAAVTVSMLGLALTAVISTPATAQADSGSGHRVCVEWHSAQGDRGVNTTGEHWGTGLATKVGKDDSDTCDTRLGTMDGSYGQAWQGSFGQHFYRMETCQTFAAKTGLQDPCDSMGDNTIYKYTSKFDQLHPASQPSIWWWRDQ